ncbi:MAG: site-specific DNA-methyltransferase, partial [Halobacteriaceae archaeon]
DGSVELVVTSPPYPMVEMWDDAFAALDPAVGDALAAGDGEAAFDLMHAVLDETWAEVERALVDGGVACVVVGDATRTVGDRFARYPNHARVTDWFTDHGFTALPEVLWRKPTNSAAKFMGSGMLPPNAYVTLEHEHVLVFRKGTDGRRFEPGAEDRYEAAYFWEERNRWFSDLWEVTGERQALDGPARERSAAFPFEIPYRLVNMYSVYGDTVLDPFLGTGTTSVAAMVAGRDSVGYEREPSLAAALEDAVDSVPALSRDVVEGRLADHRDFVAERAAAGDAPGYEATHYDVRVTTTQEQDLRLYAVESVEETGDGTYTAVHEPVESVPASGDAPPAGGHR